MLKMGFFLGRPLKWFQMAQDIAAKNSPTCCKCEDQQMQIGYIPTKHSSGVWQPLQWFRAKAEGILGVRTFNKEFIFLVSFRCPKCGYIESYAPDLDK